MASGTIRYRVESATTRRGFAYAEGATLPVEGVPNELANQIANSYTGFAANAVTIFDRKAGIAALLALGFTQTGTPDSPVFKYGYATFAEPAKDVSQSFLPAEPTFEDEPDSAEAPAATNLQFEKDDKEAADVGIDPKAETPTMGDKLPSEETEEKVPEEAPVAESAPSTTGAPETAQEAPKSGTPEESVG